MNSKFKTSLTAVSIALVISVLFLVVVIFITEISPISHKYMVARISEDKDSKFIKIGKDTYYDPDTYIVYTGNTSTFDYRVPVPLRTSSGEGYTYNPITNEIEHAK